MYTIQNSILTQPFEKLQVQKLVKEENYEILVISLEKGTIFPEHTSPRNVQLIILEGDIDFHINQQSYHLQAQQSFNFPKEETHWVKANENSKFLIIR